MADLKDPAIKLFGKTIQLPLIAAVPPSPELQAPIPSPSDDNPKKEQEEESSSTNLIDCDKEEGNRSSSIRSDLKEEQSEITTSSREKTLKKPDKILPCPRCNSMDTKFCYFNNYNVNQPRHFCKNCQRYWTAGGSMRNVPVGAGRRKNKSSPAVQSRHVVVPDPAAGVVFNSIRGGGSVERTSRSSEMEKQERVMSGFCGFPAPPWAPWGGAVAGPGFVPAGYPVSVYAGPAYWNVAWVPRPSVSVEQSSTSSGPNSPLGKHSRERDEPETKVLVPKTLRIDDPNEAAKSSIWATLGIRNEKVDSVNSGGLFRGFRPKGEEASPIADTSLVLQANPAAMSRSLTFRESAE